jgi:hypothetical protein
VPKTRNQFKAIETTPEHYQGVSAENNGPPEDEQHVSSNSDEQDLPHGDVTLDTVIETFREWLDLPDAGFIEVLLATYAANQIPGDPVWLLAVGPSSGGKTDPVVLKNWVAIMPPLDNSSSTVH